MTLVDDDEVDGLDLGRPPLSRQTRIRIGVAATVLVVAGGVIALRAQEEPSAPPAAPPAAAATPSTGFAGGPVLTEVDGHTQLSVPGGAMFGGATMNVALAPAPDAVAAVRRGIPSLDAVRGGRVENPEIHYGIYLTGSYRAVDGSPVTLTIYTARAPETARDVQTGVNPVIAGDERVIRTDVSYYTGTGWWVHAVAQAGTPDPVSGDQAAVVQAVALDPVLVS